jgi:hypothetical protein
MEIFVIILLIVFILSVTLGFTYNDKVAKKCFEIQKYSLIALCAVCVCGIISISTPKAIDVYRGRTTLEITYKDSIPVDSIVVFKE